MANATNSILTDQYDVPPQVLPSLLSFPVAAAAKLYPGTFAATNTAGNAVQTVTSTSRIWGRVNALADNTSGAAGAINVEVQAGAFYFNNDATNAVSLSNTARGTYVYAVDNNTVGTSSLGGTLPVAGYMIDVPASTAVEYGKVLIMVGVARPDVLDPELTSTGAFRARNVAAAGNVASLAAFTVAGNDGVTNVAGDVVILDTQTTVAQNGPYVVGTVATGTAPLTRPDWWGSGSTIKSGASIAVGGQGTVFKNTRWVAMVAADSFVVDTTDPKLYPASVTGSTVLVAGTFTISTVPVFSLDSNVALSRKVANTATLTVGGYHPTTGGSTGITAGIRGTAAVIVEACVGAGTISVADVSTLHWTIINQP